MGEAKQLLPLGETTLLGHTLATIRRSAVDTIILVLGASASAIQQRHDTAGLQIVHNPDYAGGMSTSLRAGLAAVPQDHAAAFIVLADQPLLQPATLDHLAQHYRQSKAQIVVPTWQGTRGNPVLLDRSVFAEVMALQGDVGCRAIFAKHEATLQKLEVKDEGILQDIDNRKDYQQLLQKHFPEGDGLNRLR